MDETRIAAFVEFVLRPMAEDWRLILDRIKDLGLPLDAATLRSVATTVGRWHVIGEVIRAVSYVGIVWLVCTTVRAVL